jgi:hypothetical protein
MQFYASKNVGQFAPESLGQFDWIVQIILPAQIFTSEKISRMEIYT